MRADTKCTLKSGQGRGVLSAAILASGAAFMSGSAIPVALPTIQKDFGSTFGDIQWTINAGLLTLGALILIGGSLGDLYGRKRIFLVGIGIFGLAALLSALAPTLEVLIGLQALQGVGAALMVPQSLAIINDCFEKGERGRVIGLWAGISGGIAALGPLVGGVLVDRFNWSAIFLLIAPLSFFALVTAMIFIPRTVPQVKGRLDWAGALTVLIGLTGLIYGLMNGPSGGWTEFPIIVSLAIGILSLGMFIMIETRKSEPLVYLKIFRYSLVTGANLVTLLVYFGLNGITFFTVLNLQQIQGYSPTRAGIALLPPIVLITFLTWPTGILADKFGPRLQMIVGPLLVAAGMVIITTGGTTPDYLRNFFPRLTIFGLGMAAIIPPLTKSALTVEEKYSGSASGINNGVSRVAGLLSIAILGAIVTTLFQGQLAGGLGNSQLTAVEQQEILAQSNKLGGIVIPGTFSQVARLEAKSVIDDVFIFAYYRVMYICAALALAGAIVSVILIHNEKNKPEAV
jgi:EmrB/QacA subfamily drug resistance transporter